MTFRTKIVKNVDDNIWRQFSGKCKMENVLTGHKLNEVLKNYLNEENNI